jgi:hypothetical protein
VGTKKLLPIGNQKQASTFCDSIFISVLFLLELIFYFLMIQVCCVLGFGKIIFLKN